MDFPYETRSSRKGLSMSYADVAAARLRMTEATTPKAVQRLCQRYRELPREEFAHTVGAPQDVESELGHLLNVFTV